MKKLMMTVLLAAAAIHASEAAQLPIPYPNPGAPVIHSGRYHVLTCGKTSVVLDGARGMSIQMISYAEQPEKLLDTSNAVLTDAHLRATVQAGGKTFALDQVNDPAPRLQIIDQGPGRVAARSYFALCSPDGIPHGSGTLDLYVYDGRVHLAPSMYIDYEADSTIVTEAEFDKTIPGSNADLFVDGSQLLATGQSRFLPFGDDGSGFSVTVDSPGHASAKIGWLRNRYPAWLYLRETDSNPETDELYEKWPPWITQRGAPLAWKRTATSGLLAQYSGNSLQALSFRWVNGDSLTVPSGGYEGFHGLMAVFFGPDSAATQELWKQHEKPVKPQVTSGDFRYYNEIEGVYEIDSKGGDVDAVFSNAKSGDQRPVFVRLWNLKGKGGCDIAVDRMPAPFMLYNDGDCIEDPMVPIVKETTGPARFAGIGFVVEKGTSSRLTMKQTPGMQLAYQMYSPLETLEAWSDVCAGKPLFSLHLSECTIYHATLPGKDEYAFAKLPLFWLKNGVNNDTFMNRIRGFQLETDGPDKLRFTITGVNLQGTGLSKYTLEVPYERDRITFSVSAEFSSLDDGNRWTSIEYCDLYPFDNVYRRTFHYGTILFLTQNGVFDRVGSGAWSGRFQTIVDENGMSYHADYVSREGPGSKTPDSADGAVWILGDNPDRGNILYRRGDWNPSEGSQSVFSLCNAWVDIHNTITGRTKPGAVEKISYTVEVFPGALPSVERLTELYRKAASGETVKQVVGVQYSDNGVIEGFKVK